MYMEVATAVPLSGQECSHACVFTNTETTYRECYVELLSSQEMFVYMPEYISMQSVSVVLTLPEAWWLMMVGVHVHVEHCACWGHCTGDCGGMHCPGSTVV